MHEGNARRQKLSIFNGDGMRQEMIMGTGAVQWSYTEESKGRCHWSSVVLRQSDEECVTHQMEVTIGFWPVRQGHRSM